MFILHSSNKTENLFTHLTSVIENVPLSTVLSKEIFLIQSQGMERWLSQQLANYFGIWGNYEFLFPHKFFSFIATQLDTHLKNDDFDREIMLWRFEFMLRHLNDSCFAALKYYLSGENIDLKRYQLANQLSQIFDQYQMMRPEMLALWQKGQLLYQSETERWQSTLWQNLTQIVGDQHRGSNWQQIIDKLNRANESEFSNQLPERIFIFGINTMPPLFLDYLQGLSRHCDIHFFLLNPTQVYWADLVKKGQLDSTTVSQTHPLLSTLGQQGREFQQMLLERASFNYEPESFQSTEINNNLHQLQYDILNNRIAECTVIKSLKPDNSISIHACHSRMREVEVLKNQLLSALENDTDLELVDIVVMAPDIQHYAPFISATFSDIQHSIADRSFQISNTLVDAFIGFLKLSQSRFGWQSVMDLLEKPVVYQSFSLSETDIELIKHWVEETHVRWGKSAAHKKQLGLPELSENTWKAALDRLLMGYAVGDDNSFIDDVLPYRELEGSSAQLLGGLYDFIQLLFKASDELTQATSLKNWVTRLNYFADQILTTSNQTEQLQRLQLNEILDNLLSSSQYHSENISLEVIINWFENRMSEQKSSTGFLRGQLTFCSMLPMRSIPFKVIALLGLNDGEFPKIDHQQGFDLISQNFRLGDRSRRADDRYQFLEILLSARQQLIISFIGLSNQRNNDIPPSVVVSEFLEVLENDYQLTNIITQHPLQPFSQSYFIENAKLFSFSKTDFETAYALNNEIPGSQLWWQGTIQPSESNIIDINELFSFFRHPQQYFLQQRLGVRFTGLASVTEEREPFLIDSLDAYAINQQWVEHNLNESDFSLKKLQAQGLWLSGVIGEIEFNQQQQNINQFTDLIKQLGLGGKKPDLAIDIQHNNYRLIGNLSNIYQHGSLIYRYANLKGKDIILAWLHHLIINRVEPQDTHLLSLDESLNFTSQQQQDSLEQLISIYLQGQQHPGIFFTEASFAYVKQSLKLKTGKKATRPAIDSAQEQLIKEIQYNRSLQQLYSQVGDLTELLNDDFVAVCEDLILPLWEEIHG